MTETEWARLFLGIEIGIMIMLIVQAVDFGIDRRRNNKVARNALKRSAGDLYLSSFRRYQLRAWRQERPAARVSAADMDTARDLELPSGSVLTAEALRKGRK
jgi:hypothetical protein